ncbi:MAG: Ig-like domain-containing protein [bacterium]
MRRIATTILSAAATTLLVVSCGGDGATVGAPAGAVSNGSVPTTIVLSPGTPVTLQVGAAFTLSASVRNAFGQTLSGTSVTWTSTDASVVSVSNGAVAALGPGTASVTAASGPASASVAITVVKAASVSAVMASLSQTTLPVSSLAAAVATVVDSAGNVLSGRVVTWISSNPAVASVTATGSVAALSVGTCVLTATSEGRSSPVTLIVSAASMPGIAVLPLTYINTAAPPAPDAGGVVITVNAGDNLQAAINTAQPGDVIALANGATFTGNFTLPAKASASTRWITIRPQNVSGLPAEGVRMTPAIAAFANIPRILSPSNLGAISTLPGAHHYRLTGVEVSMAPGVDPNTGLIRFGDDGANGQTTLASVPHDLVLDRSYVHGTASAVLRRAVALNSASSAIIDSYLSDCHDKNGTDAQAINGWNGPGPFKITNNYLEGSSENILWGGSDPGIPNLVPSDIEIRRNHFSKPVAWKGVWSVKNLYESKNSQRVLIEGNLFENNWQDGQAGTAISLKSSSVGACSWCVTQDVTFRYNLVRNVGGAIVLSGSPDNDFPDIHARRLTFTDNIFQNINSSAAFDGIGYGVLVNGDPGDVSITHNTIVSPTNSAVYFSGPGVAAGFSMRDNIIDGGAAGVKGSGVTAGLASLLAFATGGVFSSNVLVVGSSAGYPSNNFYPVSLASVGFGNALAGDLRLVPSSPYKRSASDGRDPGADVEAILAVIQGIIVP